MNVRDIAQEFQESTPGDWSALHHFLWQIRVKVSYMKAPGGTPLSRIKPIIGFTICVKRLQWHVLSNPNGR